MNLFGSSVDGALSLETHTSDTFGNTKAKLTVGVARKTNTNGYMRSIVYNYDNRNNLDFEKRGILFLVSDAAGNGSHHVMENSYGRFGYRFVQIKICKARGYIPVVSRENDRIKVRLNRC